MKIKTQIIITVFSFYSAPLIQSNLPLISLFSCKHFNAI